MVSTWSEVLAKLKEDKTYKDAFAAIYPDGLIIENVRDAIASFERSLLTPGSRFDQWLMGDEQALTKEYDRYFFKVPNLRLAVLTPLYFHDAHARSLDEAIRDMGLYQFGRCIPSDHTKSTAAFLSTLVGTHPKLSP